MKLHYFSVMLVAAMAGQPQDNFEPKLEVNEITLTGGPFLLRPWAQVCRSR